MTLESFLEERGIDFEPHVHREAFTSQDLAAAEHVSGYMVAKPVVVRTSSGFAMCVLPAPKHLDLRRVGALLHEPEVRLATEKEMAELFPDCELGAEPPLGVMYEMDTLMDAGLQEDEYVVMQSGTHTSAVKMLGEDFERLCHPIVASIAMG